MVNLDVKAIGESPVKVSINTRKYSHDYTEIKLSEFGNEANDNPAR